MNKMQEAQQQPVSMVQQAMSKSFDLETPRHWIHLQILQILPSELPVSPSERVFFMDDAGL